MKFGHFYESKLRHKKKGNLIKRIENTCWSENEDDNQTKNTSLAAPGAFVHHLQRRTACNATEAKMANRGPKNGRRSLEILEILGYCALQTTFAK